jgi:NADPH:quinone reductase-like Zn-dependent oxidoreductase
MAMRAVAVTAFGAAPQVMDLPRPVPGPGEVLVRLAAAGMNPADWQLADGHLRERMEHVFPLVLGWDGAGTVAAVGDGVTRFAEGDGVYGQFFLPPAGRGTFAELVAIDERAPIGPPPRRVEAAAAVALPTAAMTALGLLDAAGVGSGDTVLVVGASGGVGVFVTQLAAARGARVIATARPDAAALVRRLGAAETLDYQAGPLAERLRAGHPDGVDVLLDLVSDPASFAAHSRQVRDGGTAASIVFAAPAGDGGQAGRVRAMNYLVADKPALLARITREVDAGRLQIPVQREVRLEDAPAALARLRAGGARGKTVITI